MVRVNTLNNHDHKGLEDVLDLSGVDEEPYICKIKDEKPQV